MSFVAQHRNSSRAEKMAIVLNDDGRERNERVSTLSAAHHNSVRLANFAVPEV